MYRFGARSYSADDIRRIASAHGRDGIGYYPPQDWGGPMAKRPSMPVRPHDPLEALYLDAYREGYYQTHPRKDT